MEVTDSSGAISAASPSTTATLRRVTLFDQININVFWIAIEGVTLQLLRGLPDHLGYSTLFAVTIVYFALGTLVIRQVKGVK